MHHSWLNIERKIRLYSTQAGTYGWTRHWEQLTGKEYVDNAESNMFFDKPWSEVTDEDIKIKARELSENTGGHVFHTKYRGQRTPWMTLKRVNGSPQSNG
jgi:hypothetical protein